MTMPAPPPFYILVSPSTLGSHTSLLHHPTVQFHYADDHPTALLPTAEHPNVVILEPQYPPDTLEPNGIHSSSSPQSASAASAITIVPSQIATQPPSVHSLSGSIAVTGVRVAQPPASAVTFATNEGKNPNIYIVDYVPLKPATGPEEGHRMEDSIRDNQSTSALLAQFHQRNELLRNILESTQ